MDLASLLSSLTARQAREVAMFLMGATAFMHEVLAEGVERPFILSASLALMGLPFVLKGERALRENGNGNGDGR